MFNLSLLFCNTSPSPCFVRRIIIKPYRYSSVQEEGLAQHRTKSFCQEKVYVCGVIWGLHVTYDTLGEVNLCCRVQLPNSSGLGVKVFWRYFRKDQLHNKSINYKSVYKTAFGYTGSINVVCMSIHVAVTHQTSQHQTLKSQIQLVGPYARLP